jgi:hypothetical protein
MCSLFSAELESQSWSERVEARSDQTPEFRLFDSACLPDYPAQIFLKRLLFRYGALWSLYELTYTHGLLQPLRRQSV